ncbi:hypothetical protein ACFWHR_12185 [Leucobacter sp. NPDC058333]|uniref:hypothetical protein n=1 Tax=Leucobacter sp. NPDC058333 TaxID=3346450 RepID=UPI00365F7063
MATVSSFSVKEVGTPSPSPEVIVFAELEHLEFWKRIDELRAVGRVSPEGESQLHDMARDSTDLREFGARLHYGAPHLMGPVEQRYVTSALETPEGRRPESWEESTAHVRAFGSDQYQSVTAVHQQERDRQLEATRAYS